MSTLYVMCGAPGSGKSTWANKFIDGRAQTVYLSRDAVRMSIITDKDAYFSHEDEVYDKFTDLIVEKLTEGVDVVADATHLSRGSRKKLVNTLAAKGMTFSMYDLIFVMMDTPEAVCIKRDATRTGRQHVTADVISRMCNQIQIPTIGEFSHVKEVWLIRA